MKILYLSPNGIGTALVRSQVLPYLRGVAARGIDVRLLTFERGEPFPDGEFPRERWHAMRPRSGSGLPAKGVDIVAGAATILRLHRRHRFDALHARSYLPAAIAWLVSRLTGVPYVFDMRGFLGEEYVDAGRWTRSDVRYLTLRLAEGALLHDSSAVVVLTHAAAERLRRDRRYAKATAGRDITVIPCAVDLERFRPHSARAPIPTLVYSGSLGMWYLLDEMLRVYAYARALESRLRLLIINRHEGALIEAAVGRAGLAGASIEVRGAGYDEMPGLLAEAHVSIALLRQVSSKLASSPIKIGEYLACGLPVAVNEGLGDAPALVRRYGAGHVVASYSHGEIQAAGTAVAALLVDERARLNARRLAEEVLDLRTGVERYVEIYDRLSRRRQGM